MSLQPINADGLDLGARAGRDRYRARVEAALARVHTTRLREACRQAGDPVTGLSARSHVVRTLANAWILQLRRGPRGS